MRGLAIPPFVWVFVGMAIGAIIGWFFGNYLGGLGIGTAVGAMVTAALYTMERKDGRWFILSMVNEARQYAPFMHAIGLTDLIENFEPSKT